MLDNFLAGEVKFLLKGIANNNLFLQLDGVVSHRVHIPMDVLKQFFCVSISF